MTSRTRTVYVPSLIPKETADELFTYLYHHIAWEVGIKNTRRAKALSLDSEPIVTSTVLDVLNSVDINPQRVLGLYLNLYRDGNDYTPSHSHNGTDQLVISLGGVRTLNVGRKSFTMQSGDVIYFGTSTHGVPKEAEAQPRISIAVFLAK